VTGTRTTIWTALFCMLAISTWSHAASPSASEAFRDIRKIATEDGIEQQEMVTLGGVPQWISIRSRHRNAPILLVVHGGPGFTLSPVSDYYLRDLEEFFAVVQWDQRGAGKSYRREDQQSLAPTLTIDRLTRDAEELIELLRTRYKRDRVVLMAHSFGTIIGVKVAQKRPDLLYAYVGTGQFVNAMRSEALRSSVAGWRNTAATFVPAARGITMPSLNSAPHTPPRICRIARKLTSSFSRQCGKSSAAST
jgi:proline iminopeptidase